MKQRVIMLAQAAVLFGVIVLPHPERAAHLEKSISRGRMIENAYIVADAAERFAEANEGFYPAAVANLANYLPDQGPLLNPVHLLGTEPVDGQASTSGETGYVPLAQQGYNVGYSITAFGADATWGPAGDGVILHIQRVTDPPPPPVTIPD